MRRTREAPARLATATPAPAKYAITELFANNPKLAYRPLEPNWICGNKPVLQWATHGNDASR
jgi:hypothetical protein